MQMRPKFMQKLTAKIKTYEFFKPWKPTEILDPSTLFILSTDNKYLKYLEK